MKKNGFTLIEMLVVISIITILMAVGSFGIKDFTKSQGVSTAVPIAEGMVQLAKIDATALSSRARLLIHAQNSPENELHRERYLRYLIVQTLNYGPDGQSDTSDDFWEIKSRGKALPKNAWFIPSLSNQTGLTIPTITVKLPAQAEGETSLCYYYEFNSQGILVDPAPNTIAPRFILGGGSLPPGTVEPITENKNYDGFVIWRNGTTSKIRHPEQIGL